MAQRCKYGRTSKGSCKSKPTPSGQRTRVCRKTKTGVKCVYVKRNKKGRITDIQNIGRATRRDSATRSRIKPTRKGQGHRGDY